MSHQHGAGNGIAFNWSWNDRTLYSSPFTVVVAILTENESKKSQNIQRFKLLKCLVRSSSRSYKESAGFLKVIHIWRLSNRKQTVLSRNEPVGNRLSKQKTENIFQSWSSSLSRNFLHGRNGMCLLLSLETFVAALVF